MGITAENVAEKFHISRMYEDIFAIESQRRAAVATAMGSSKKKLHPMKSKQKNSSFV